MFVFVLVIGLLVCQPISAEDIRYHGFQLDESHRLVLAEDNGSVRIGIVMRTRPRGGVSPAGASARYTDAEYLVEVRSEVIRPAEPNSFQNPGRTYRLSIQGLKIAPDYANMVEVDATNARATLVQELEKVRARASGLEDEAIRQAEPLALEVFKVAYRMPADILTSVKMSKSGAFRITQGTQERRRIAPAQTFAPRLEIARPEAGATARARAKAGLPKQAVSGQTVRGPKAAAPAGPRTPAAAGQAGKPPAPRRVSTPWGTRPVPGAVAASDDLRYTGTRAIGKTWEETGAPPPSVADQAGAVGAGTTATSGTAPSVQASGVPKATTGR